ncbi:hypothetical protein BU26DRAFT_582722 [Trematosphaeria pertusa]|uniref:Secreted protein n=1 Tax=Trematosphaeria pertusa TaxID=390896 RepID=A0A6A6IWE2_9PLEO|nr:uncharacterized protein BU26DRAFT_582722 [Trematosphaeria pertusa]KAF2254252.1 hypothetical protein BU26DRAFT_582722 [Trematosphaeria pertusa]
MAWSVNWIAVLVPARARCGLLPLRGLEPLGHGMPHRRHDDAPDARFNAAALQHVRDVRVTSKPTLRKRGEAHLNGCVPRRPERVRGSDAPRRREVVGGKLRRRFRRRLRPRVPLVSRMLCSWGEERDQKAEVLGRVGGDLDSAVGVPVLGQEEPLCKALSRSQSCLAPAGHVTRRLRGEESSCPGAGAGRFDWAAAMVRQS